MTVFVFLVAVFLNEYFSGKPAESGLFGLNAAYPNYGYIGVLLAFGPDVVVPMALILVSNNILLLLLSIFTQMVRLRAGRPWTNIVTAG